MNKIASQNHRIVGDGRDLWRSSVQPPAKAGSVQQVAQVDIQMGFEYLEKETPQPLWAAEELQILFVFNILLPLWFYILI